MAKDDDAGRQDVDQGDPEARRFKSEIDGLNRRNSLLETENAKLAERITALETQGQNLAAAAVGKTEALDLVDLAAQLKAREALVKIKELAIEYAGQQGIPMDVALRMAAGSWEQTQASIDAISKTIAERAEALSAADIAERFGKAGKPGGGDYRYSSPTWDNLLKMPDGSATDAQIDQAFKASMREVSR